MRGGARLLLAVTLLFLVGRYELPALHHSAERDTSADRLVFQSEYLALQPDTNRVWFTYERLGGGSFRFRAETLYPEILDFTWDFGDGFGSPLRSPRHIFRPVTIPRVVTLRARGDREYSHSETILPFIEYDFESRVLAAVEAGEVTLFAGRFIPESYLATLRELHQQRTLPDLQRVLIRLRRDEVLSGFGGRESSENHPESYLLLTNPVTGEVVAVLTSQRGDFRYDLISEERRYNEAEWQEQFRSYRPIFVRFSD